MTREEGYMLDGYVWKNNLSQDGYGYDQARMALGLFEGPSLAQCKLNDQQRKIEGHKMDSKGRWHKPGCQCQYEECPFQNR